MFFRSIHCFFVENVFNVVSVFLFGFILFCLVLVWFGLVWFGLVWFGLVWFCIVMFCSVFDSILLNYNDYSIVLYNHVANPDAIDSHSAL